MEHALRPLNTPGLPVVMVGALRDTVNDTDISKRDTRSVIPSRNLDS